jgi:hypothetical protein
MPRFPRQCPSGFLTKTLYTHLFSPIHATCTTHLILSTTLQAHNATVSVLPALPQHSPSAYVLHYCDKTGSQINCFICQALHTLTSQANIHLDLSHLHFVALLFHFYCMQPLIISLSYQLLPFFTISFWFKTAKYDFKICDYPFGYYD